MAKHSVAGLSAVLLYSFAILFLGCEDDGIPFNELSEATAKAACANIMRCCTSDELDDAGITGVYSLEDCLEEVRENEDLVMGVIRDGYEHGEVHYDSKNADECLDLMESAPCDTEYPSICREVFAPKQNQGQVCHSQISCIDGFCEGLAYIANPLPGEDPIIPGNCISVSEGDSCSPGVCMDGLYCECPEESPDCLDAFGECVREKQLGEPCEKYGQCEDQSYCSQDGICVEYKDEGDDCGENVGRCRSGLICNTRSLSCEKPCSNAITELGCYSTGDRRSISLLSFLVALFCLSLVRRISWSV